MVAVVVRAALPWTIRRYVNRTLDLIPRFSGEIGRVDLSLWRGAYAVSDIRLSSRAGNVPVPFLTADRVAFSIEPRGLLHGKVVGRVLIERPEINFVEAAAPSQFAQGFLRIGVLLGVHDADVGTLPGEQQRNGLANPAVAAGDYRHLALQPAARVVVWILIERAGFHLLFAAREFLLLGRWWLTVGGIKGEAHSRLWGRRIWRRMPGS